MTWLLWFWLSVACGSFAAIANVFAWRHFRRLIRQHMEAGSPRGVLMHLHGSARRSVARSCAGALGVVTVWLPSLVWPVMGILQGVLVFVSVADWWTAKMVEREVLRDLLEGDGNNDES